MAWPYGPDDEPPRTWQLRKSKYWSDVCKDLGKYIRRLTWNFGAKLPAVLAALPHLPLLSSLWRCG